MTKEQEVIKNIKTYIHDWVNESVDEDGYERYVIDEWDKEFMNDIETVLNMLKEKDKEIKTLKRDFKIVDQECSRLERKEAKQDKIIDLMAEFLGEKDMGYYKKEEGGEFLGIMRRYSKEDWKQYFERKVKHEN